MEPSTLGQTVLDSLAAVAPEADLAALRDGDLLHEVLDLDSFDFLTFVQELFERTGVDIPELDYPRVATLRGAVEYLAAHQPA